MSLPSFSQRKTIACNHVYLPAMKKALITILKYVIFLGLGIWITYHMLHELSDQQRSELVNAIESIDPWYLIPISVVGFFSHYIRAVRWKYLLETIDLHPTTANTFFAVMIGYITNLALPRAGEVAKCTVLAKYEDMPAHKMVGTIVAERAWDVLCLFLIAIAAFVMQMSAINAYVGSKMAIVHEKIEAHKTVLVISLIVFALIILVLIIIYRRNKESKGGMLLKEMTHGILSIIHMKKKWEFLLLSVVMWIMYLLQVYIGLRSLHDTHAMSMMAALVVLVYGSLGLIITPGGIGAYPYLVAQILSGPYSIPEVPAQAFGWIAWALQTVLIILLGLLSLLLIHSYNKKRNAKAAVDNK